MSASGHATGRLGEEAAVRHLLGLGWRIVARNFRVRGGELDIIAEDGGTLVFVEVKTRASTRRGLPGEAVTPAKARRLVHAACAYLTQAGAWGRPCRFDLVAVVGTRPPFAIDHLRHILDTSDALDRRHAPWQPW